MFSGDYMEKVVRKVFLKRYYLNWNLKDEKELWEMYFVIFCVGRKYLVSGEDV